MAALIIGAPAVSRAQLRGRAALEAIVRGRSVEGTFQVQWTPDGAILEREQAPGADQPVFYRVDPVTGARAPLFADSVVRVILEQYNRLTGAHATALPVQAGSWGSRQTLLFTGIDDKRYVFDFVTLTLRRLSVPKLGTPPDADALMRNMAGSQLVNGTFAPDYAHFAYVLGYDLYVTNTATGVETRLTTGGSDSVMNGRPDWVYPEELNQTEAFFWSPDGKHLAYLRFDERPVVPYTIEHAKGATEHQRYPVAGAKNPVVTLHVVDITTGKTVTIATKSSPDVYIVRPNWTPDGHELLFQRLNRRQDTLELLAANPRTGAVRRVLVEHDRAYVNLDPTLGGGFGATLPGIWFLKDGRRFLWGSERDGWAHWYLYDLTGRQLAQVTHGRRVFRKVLAVDEAKGVLYATAATDEGQERHLFRAKLDGSGVTQVTKPGGIHEINMAPTGRYYVDVFSTPSRPRTAELHDAGGTLVRRLGQVTYDMHGVTLTSPQAITVKAADGVTNLHGRLYTPIGFDPTRTYPLLVEVYGGPQVQQVGRQYVVADEYQEEAQGGYVVLVVDNRGTPNRGRDFERATFLKLGQVDLDDQVAAVRQVLRAHPYIDSTRVGIVGSSFGGYMTAMALLRYPSLFRVGIASSAVTDWRFYDTIYTERYMRRPVDNPEGYRKGSAFTYVGKLAGHLLIEHGTADNNVHLENATKLKEAFEKAGKRIDFELYSEARHGVPTDTAYLAKYLTPIAER